MRSIADHHGRDLNKSLMRWLLFPLPSMYLYIGILSDEGSIIIPLLLFNISARLRRIMFFAAIIRSFSRSLASFTGKSVSRLRSFLGLVGTLIAVAARSTMRDSLLWGMREALLFGRSGSFFFYFSVSSKMWFQLLLTFGWRWSILVIVRKESSLHRQCP